MSGPSGATLALRSSLRTFRERSSDRARGWNHYVLCSSLSPKTPTRVPTSRPLSSGSRSESTAVSSGSRVVCSNAYCRSGRALSGALRRITSSGRGLRTSPSESYADAS